MIKKFEEFINENYSSTGEDFYERLKVLLCDTLGFGEADYAAIMRKLDDTVYTFEEVEEIISRVRSVFKPTVYMIAFLKSIFDESLSIEKKNKILNHFSKTKNKQIPLVIGIDGKVLAGEVYYCEQLDAYAKDEDDFEDAAEEWLYELADDEAVLDDDRPDWVSNRWEDLNIYKVDLDKEFNYTEK